MLELLTFDLMVDNPYHRLFELLGQLEAAANKTLRQAAWAFCNDACLTALPLLMEAHDIAIAGIFFASVHTRQLINDVDGEPWWRYIGGEEDRCVRAITTMRQFYDENPLRRQNPSMGSPPFLLENTRRRGEILHGQTPPHTATPLGTESPRRQNGERGQDGLDVPPKEPTEGERVNGQRSVSPMKRKEADSELEGGPERKRMKESEEGEEGEVVDL